MRYLKKYEGGINLNNIHRKLIEFAKKIGFPENQFYDDDVLMIEIHDKNHMYIFTFIIKTLYNNEYDFDIKWSLSNVEKYGYTSTLLALEDMFMRILGASKFTITSKSLPHIISWRLTGAELESAVDKLVDLETFNKIKIRTKFGL